MACVEKQKRATARRGYEKRAKKAKRMKAEAK
jgi:hypothetical protein